MVAKTFVLNGENILDRVSDFIRYYHQEAHESQYPGGFLRVYEEYSFLNGNDLMICLRVDSSGAENGKVLVEMISGGANSTFLFKTDAGSEDRRIKLFTKELEEFCKRERIEMTSLIKS